MNPLAWLSAPLGGSFGLAPLTIAADLLLSFVLGTFVAWLYSTTHRGLAYSRNMVHSIVLLAMIITMVMLVVGDSIARAFGLVGALAIIRFRTVVRDARDTTFIFLALAVGISVGAQQELVAIIGTGMIALVAAVMQYSGFATRHSDTGMLRVRSVGGAASAIEGVLGEWCRTHELIALRQGGDGEPSEYSYEIRLYNPGERDELVKAVRAVEGTSQVTIAIEERAEEW